MTSPYANYTPTDSSYPQMQQDIAPTFAAPSPSSNPPRGKARTGSNTSKRSRNSKANATASPRPPTQDVSAGASGSTTPGAQWQQGDGSGVTISLQPAGTDPTGVPTQSIARQQTVLVLPGADDNPLLGAAGKPLADGRGSLVPGAAGDEEADGDDDLLPAMADDDYSAQLSFQTQSKDNLKVLMDNFSAEQYDRYEAYRRNALPKQAVRRVVQQALGQQVSMPVAQIVAGFGKVFVGEIVEKARHVQQQRGETGPLAPDHLREAYSMYQEETGRVGAARPLRGKKLFVR